MTDLAAIATRTVAFVAESLGRFDNLLLDNEHRLNPNEQQIYASLLTRSSEIRTRLFRRVLTLVAAAEAESEIRLARATVEATPIFSSIVDLHRDLRHLPVPELRRESEVFVSSLWRSLSPLVNAEEDRPALHLSHDLIHGQHNIRLGPAVIDLPKIDYSAPLSWPLIAHEIAHRILPAVDVPANLSSVVAAWLIEAGCDRLGMRLCGPAYLAAFALRTFVDRTYRVGTNKHPPGHLRLRTFEIAASADLPITPLVQKVVSLMKARAIASETGGVKLPEAGARVLSCQSCKKPFTLLETDEAERTFTQILPDYIGELDDELLKIPTLAPSPQHTDKLAEQLRHKRLIGGFHDDDLAAKEYAALRNAVEGNEPMHDGDIRGVLLKRTVDALVDHPNAVLDIITAGWEAYLHNESDVALAEVVLAARGEEQQWESFRSQIRQFDDLLLASIETAHFQSLLTPSVPRKSDA
jgi:hypothetical protein